MNANRRHFRVFLEIGVEEHDDDVIFQTGSRNTVVSRMRNVSGHNYRNSAFIVDVAMGQIPRYTERISSLKSNHFCFKKIRKIVTNCSYNYISTVV